MADCCDNDEFYTDELFLARRSQSWQNLVFQPFLRGEPEDAHAEIAQGETAYYVDPEEERGTNPATAPAHAGADANAPEDGANKKADEEYSKLHPNYPRSHDAAAQAGPESQPDRIG